MTRRYNITHRTVYTYSDEVSASYGRGYLQPRELPWQRLLSHQVETLPAASDQAVGTDVYGNADLYFHVTTTHTRLEVTSRSLVEVNNPVIDPLLASQPWERSRPDGAIGADEVDFELASPLIDLIPSVHEYALVSFTPGRPIEEAIIDLTRRIFTDFQYKSGSTTISTRIPDLMNDRRGVCQDFAHLALSCLRSLGLAGRYVSGYLVTRPPPGKPRLIGVDATHAWAAVWLRDDQWLAFDPTNNQLVDERYTTVAWGRDYADVPPLKGVIYTDAKKSEMAVAVDVAPVGTEDPEPLYLSSGS